MLKIKHEIIHVTFNSIKRLLHSNNELSYKNGYKLLLKIRNKLLKTLDLKSIK